MTNTRSASGPQATTVSSGRFLYFPDITMTVKTFRGLRTYFSPPVFLPQLVRRRYTPSEPEALSTESIKAYQSRSITRAPSKSIIRAIEPEDVKERHRRVCPSSGGRIFRCRCSRTRNLFKHCSKSGSAFNSQSTQTQLLWHDQIRLPLG